MTNEPSTIAVNAISIFSETFSTPIAGLTTPLSRIITILKARSEGMGLNATARTFSVSKKSVIDLERRLADLKPTLRLYGLLHEFIHQEIEGDELTKVIKQTGSLSLLTDGERRYGALLFEICHEAIRNGRPGCPPKRLPKGVRARLKNKGSKKRPGRKRKKYQVPVPEHPQTEHEVVENTIHANHVEAFNATMRRRNSAFRRKTNTYAKSRDNLQRTLDVF